MSSKKVISRISNLTANLNQIKNYLENEKNLSRKDILSFSDLLDEILQRSNKISEKSKNIFTKDAAINISNSVKDYFSEIEQIENQRHLDDDDILKDIHQISFKEDYLALNFFDLMPEDIEIILSSLDEELKNVEKKKPYNASVINPIIEKVKRKLIDLHFRFDFPIIEELDENKNSYAHRLILYATELKDINPKKAKVLIDKIDEMLDLVWIAKMFMYSDFEKAKNLYNNLDEKTKTRVEKLLWRAKGETFQKIDKNKKQIISKALMNFVAEKI